MSARLRILPISTRDEGQAQHYLILDGTDLTQSEADRVVARLGPKVTEAGGVLLVFGVQVDLPEVDEDYTDHALAEAAREAAYTEPDYGTQWERWLGMMAKWEAQASENAQEILKGQPCSECAGDAGHNAPSLREREARTPAGAPAEPVCKASREVEASGWVLCDGTGHAQDHHSGRLTAGPFAGKRWSWPFGPADRAKPAEAYQIVVNMEDAHPLDVGQQMLHVLREHGRVMARGA